MKTRTLDLFDFATPSSYDSILSGVRRTDVEEVRLVVAYELEKVKARPGLKWEIYRRSNGASALLFTTSSRRDYDAFRAALENFREHFGISNPCECSDDYKIVDGRVRWHFKIELVFGRFVDE